MRWKTATLLSLAFWCGVATAEDGNLRVAGVVLAPNGKPAAEATVKLIGVGIEVTAKTDESGDFELSAEKARFALPRRAEESVVPAWQRAIVIANKDEFGPAWVRVADVLQKSEALHLTLVEDLPIQGQLVDADGRPIKGAEVTATGFADIDDSLDGFFKYSRDRPHRLSAYRQMNMRVVPDHGSLFSKGTSTTTTEAGRFEFRGLGKNRVAAISVKGRSVASDSFFVATVDKIDRKWKRKTNTPSVVRNATVAAVYPASFHHVALPGRAVTGVVRDKATGKPIAAADVSGTVGGVGVGSNHSSAKTNEEGRYEILGLRTEGRLSLRVYTPPSKGYLEASRGPIEFNAAMAPSETDFELVRGIKVRGKVIDAVTKKPVKAHLSYYTINGNQFVEQLADKIPNDTHSTDKDGNFEIIATPGPGFVCVSVHPNRYQLVSFEELGFTVDEEGFVSTNEMGLVHSQHNRIVAAHVLDASEARREITMDFELNPLGQKTLAIVDRDGKRVNGARLFAGMDPTFTRRYGEPMLGSIISVTVQPGQQLGYTYHHLDKNIGGFALIASDSQQVTNVKMRPFGSIHGRVINRPKSEGPFSDSVAAIAMVGQQPSIVSMAKLDVDGNYRLPDVVTGVKLQIVAGRLNKPKVLGEARLRTGQVLEMRDVDFAKAKELQRN